MRTDRNSEHSAYWFSAWFCLAAVYLAFSMHMPVSLYATAGHDDALFIWNAQHLLEGKWLGHFEPAPV